MLQAYHRWGRDVANALSCRLWQIHSGINDISFVGFAGHTHGGQIATGEGRPLVMPRGPLSRPFHYGRFPLPGNGELIVSRGVGCSGIPVRINADPELVICTVQ
ncbi:hypothetical protein NHH82_09885 [Oxalobacteraceae bacterium OTU3REALA1]|nr:hypothetical protein NHH82_09885 [Oxalobacteraceae bacterium OTU3REALA1]